MRDLLFKNLTSAQKRRKIIASSEISVKQGMRSIIHRHFVYIIKEVSQADMQQPSPYLYILRERNSKEQKEKFFCRMKGSTYLSNQGRLFLILYMHSLKINLTAAKQTVMGSK